MLPTTRMLNLVPAALLCVIQLAELPAEDSIVSVCRQYVDADASERSRLATQIRAYRGDVGRVIAQLAVPTDSDRQDVSGVLADQHFESSGLGQSYESDLLHFFVPENYSPQQPIGLLIFMHGGGRTTPPEIARHVVTHPQDDPHSYGLQPHFENSPFIIVAPSAPWNESTGARWNVPGADDYINAVIQECHHRFNIDRDRVFLGGYSMGGFGAFHLCQRLSDRLAGAVIVSGAWKTTHWKAWTGLPVFIRHGETDAVAPGTSGAQSRARYTDVFYARAAYEKLKGISADNVYLEDKGEHSLRNLDESWSQLTLWMHDKRRNAFARHVVAISPRGWKSSTDTPTPHCRWITIHEIGQDTIPFDAVELDGPSPKSNETREAFESQSFRLATKQVHAGIVDAIMGTDNHLTIQTDNVKRFSVWLHPSMVDFSKPVHISLNGKTQTRNINASLLDTVRSYARHRDWGQTYSAELRLDIK